MKMTLILAANPREGGAYAKRAGLPKFTYRVVHSAGQIRGVRNAEVHILPSFTESVRRHTILGALRYAKTHEIFYVDPADLPSLEEIDADRQAEHLGELDDGVLESAYAEHAEFPHEQWRAARQREMVLKLSPEEFDRIVAEIDKPGEPIPELVKAVKAAPKPRKPRPTAAAPAAADFFGS